MRKKGMSHSSDEEGRMIVAGEKSGHWCRRVWLGRMNESLSKTSISSQSLSCDLYYKQFLNDPC